MSRSADAVAGPDEDPPHLEDLVDHPGALRRLGVDAEGDIHHYHIRENAVYVVDVDGRLEHRQDLDGRPALEWWEYVAETRGWADGDPHSDGVRIEYGEVIR